MFYGTQQYTIDDKGRLTIPARYRQLLSDGLVITRGFDRNLAIYPHAEWEQWVSKVGGLHQTELEARRLRRAMFAYATHLEPDKQGRVIVPALLLDYAKIAKDVMVVGVHSYVEVWSLENWQSESEELEREGIAGQWAQLHI